MADEINLRLPASSRFVATARVTAASLAAELDFPVDRIEELRVGVNELVAVLIEWAEDHGSSEIEMSFRLGDDELEVSGRAIDGDPGGAADELDPLAQQILTVVTDGYDIRGGVGRILKRREVA